VFGRKTGVPFGRSIELLERLAMLLLLFDMFPVRTGRVLVYHLLEKGVLLSALVNML